MTAINPYLIFSGDCEDAFTFYRAVFGGQFTDLSRYADVPEDVPSPGGDPERIMHVALPLADGQVLMGSDRPASMGTATGGDNVNITVSPDSEEEARRIFDRLADGGQVTKSMEETFWGALFGMCTDRFGIHWMVNYELGQGA